MFVLGLLAQYVFDIFTLLLGFMSIYLLKSNIKIFDSHNDNENTDKLLKYIKDTSYNLKEFYYKGESKPDGLCFSWKDKYLAYIINTNENTRERVKTISKIYYLGKFKMEITKPTCIVSEKEDTNFIYIWDKDSDYIDSYIYKIKIPFDFNPYPKQKEMINNIVSHWNNSKMFISRILIYGSPGCGKSFMGKLLTHKLNGELATYINLGTPGCGFRHLYRKAAPTEKKPLIIQLDELDVIISNIHHQKNINNKHDWLVTECYNKITYNNFWSEFVIKYPYVIWLCTMNRDPSEIDKLDKCYLRNNRMDIVIPYEDKKII